ncbi:MAG: hypothetical protein K0R10_926 [Alphaproteobacteria bacterium]|jgi:hypothetical protein|nr:hypothetical protein [Alphaproteobacteria bacterium]
MLWKLFGNEREVKKALEQSVGYDITPDSPAPSALALVAANDPMELPKLDKAKGKPDLNFIAPWEDKKNA